MSGKAPSNSGVAAKVIAEVTSKPALKHVPVPHAGLTDAEKQAYLEEKGKK